MKKLFVTLMMVGLIAFSAFAQEETNSRQKAITINPNTFILGTSAGGAGISGGFEYAFSPQFSTKAQAYIIGGDASSLASYYSYYYQNETSTVVSYRFALEARWYPMENSVKGLFANGGLQYQGISGNFTLVDYEWGEWDEVTETYPDSREIRTKFKGDNTLGFFFGLGYKLVFGKQKVALAIEPTLDYAWSVHFGDTESSSVMDYWMLGMKGVRFAVHLGVAF